MSARRTPWRALLVLLVSAVLAGCGASLPTPSAVVPAVPPPAVDQAQVTAVLSSLGSTLAAGDQAGSTQALAARVTGPALVMRGAEYVRSTATQGAKAPSVLPVSQASAILPQTASWPRTFLVITQQPDDLTAPRVLVLTQTSARDQYHLWGWARLLAGVTMPTTAALDVGSPVVADDATTLVAAPKDVLGAYADLLTNGSASGSAALFAADAFQTAVAADRATQQQSAADASATFGETFSAVGGPVVNLATVDGGAVVVGELTTTSTFTAAAGQKVQNTDPFAAAVTNGASGSTLTRAYTDIVVLHVPPASAGGQVSLLAVASVITGATIS